MDNVLRAGDDIWKALGETAFMLVITIPLAVVFGTLLGTVLLSPGPAHWCMPPGCTSCSMPR